jgi:phage terminase large subunit-like protein
MAADRATKTWVKSKADEAAVDTGCHFDLAAAERVKRFFESFLKHHKSPFAGQPFELLPWQWESLVGPFYGWKRPDGTRRYRRVDCWVSKKNGKSSLCAGIVLYSLLADGESGAEVYGAAADRNQASIIYGEAKAMVEQSPALRSKLKVLDTTKRIVYEEKRSFYSVLSKDSRKTGHGINASVVVIDEKHVVNREMRDTLRYAGAARRQPSFWEISTAGNDKTSVGYETYLYAKKVAEGVIEDPELLVFIAEADSNDVWDDPVQWKKANPSLGHTITLDSFKGDFKEASQGSAAARSNFCQLRLNIWQDAVETWLPMDKWDACGGEIDEKDLEGRDCYAGLDLASTTDTASLVLLFQLADDSRHTSEFGGGNGGAGDDVELAESGENGSGKIYAALLFVWVPEEACRRRERENRTLLDNWAREGHVTKTPGDVIDYDHIREKLKYLSDRFSIRQVALDRWNATQLSVQLQGDGFDVQPFGQGYASMTAPTKALEELVLSGRLCHGGNPVFRWFASNCSVEQDAAGNLKPSKKRSTEKIDGLVALVMSLGLALQAPPAERPTVEIWG